MLVLKSFDDVVMVVKNKGNVSINLESLNSDDYLKAIDFIFRFKGFFKRVSRFKLVFNYS